MKPVESTEVICSADASSAALKVETIPVILDVPEECIISADKCVHSLELGYCLLILHSRGLCRK